DSSNTHMKEQVMGSHDQTRTSLATSLRAALPRSPVIWKIFRLSLRFVLGVVLGLGAAAAVAETPKRGGILTYMIAADGGPSFGGHRETTSAVPHATPPFYSVLIRVNPDTPASTTDFTCDLCVEMPQPTDNGLTYTFKIRKNITFHDGSPLTAPDVAANGTRS